MVAGDQDLPIQTKKASPDLSNGKVYKSHNELANHVMEIVANHNKNFGLFEKQAAQIFSGAIKGTMKVNRKINPSKMEYNEFIKKGGARLFQKLFEDEKQF